MGLGDKISNAAEEAGGKVKEKTGETTGDRDLQTQGVGEQSKANVKQSGEKVKDAAKGVSDSLKGH
ncbi:CsbD family protein [Paenarthrobacter sp.]|uniref:CsbD family protein n=1 Tax=Paenarthrobacter sp. TaxID=1931993 RepID=UPI002810A4B1|nr:CsbD family protein [Paenarthrobacter sp.]